MNPDIIVVGAGPAGSTAAKNLAEKGFDVLIIDKKKFPRDKPCGGGLPIRVLQSFPYIKKYDLIDSYSYFGIVYSSSLRYKAESEKKTPIVAMVHRDKFDTGLLEIAVDKGAEFIGGKAVKNITTSSDKVKIELNDGSSISSKIVIGADGYSSIVRKRLNLNPSNLYIAVCVYNEFLMDEKTVLDFFTDKRKVYIFLKIMGIRGYGWVFPKRDSVNIGIGEYIVGSKENNNNLKEVYLSFLSLLKKEKIIKDDLKSDKLCGGGFIFWPPKKTYTDRVLLCGDAAGFVNPLTGEGIYNAMVSGRIASEVICSSLENENTSYRFLSKYQKMWKNDFGKDLELLVKNTHNWSSDTEKFIKRVSQDNEFAGMCLDIMSGEKSFYEMRWKILRKYISIVLKEKIGQQNLL